MRVRRERLIDKDRLVLRWDREDYLWLVMKDLSCKISYKDDPWDVPFSWMRLYLHQNCNTHVLICRRYVKQCNCMYSLIMITTNLSILLSRIFLKGKTLYPLLFNQFSFKLKIVLATVLHFSIKFNFYADDTPLALCCSQYYWSLTSVQVVLLDNAWQIRLRHIGKKTLVFKRTICHFCH